MQQICIHPDFDNWRAAARQLVEADCAPEHVVWEATDDAPLLPMFKSGESGSVMAAVSVPKVFVDNARYVACHRDPQRWSLMYRMLWRITHGEHDLLQVFTDDDVHRFLSMEKDVRRDRHKMTAFVRFRKIDDPVVGERYVAWHCPDHHIVRLTAPFFRDRFSTLNWTILTPDESVSWNGHQLCFSSGVPAREAPSPDELEALWKTYYANIFNPARIKLRAMKKEMPVRHWRTLPEAELIDDLIKEAPARVEAMMKKQEACPTTTSAADFLPERITLPQLRTASKGCQGCPLYCNATQTVFGEGPADAKVMFVGEQPGDQEDLAGKPFVGPAGAVLNAAFEEAGIPRDETYVTNAVKHFKFEPRGKRRIHAKPNAREMRACRPWLESEIQVVKPQIIVALGATAAQTLMGPAFRLTHHRGEFFKDTQWASKFIATIHPSALLRMPDPAAKEAARVAFIDDLKLVAKAMR
jgi:DNA polymerase